jgi:hypothetical protein
VVDLEKTKRSSDVREAFQPVLAQARAYGCLLSRPKSPYNQSITSVQESIGIDFPSEDSQRKGSAFWKSLNFNYPSLLKTQGFLSKQFLYRTLFGSGELNELSQTVQPAPQDEAFLAFLAAFSFSPMPVSLAILLRLAR